MSPFEQDRSDMDAQVGKHLGDSISIIREDGEQVSLLGWVRNSSDEPGIGGLQPVRTQWHAKIDKTPANLVLLPQGPSTIQSLTHNRLPGPHRPAAGTIADDGNAWVFDLQKAPYA